MELHQKSSTSLRNVLDICFKRKKQIIVFFLATFCTVAVGTFIVKPVYLSQTQVLVKVGRENIYIPATGNSAPVIDYDNQEKLNSAIEILKSPSLVEKTVLTLGPTAIYEDLKDVELNRLKTTIKEFKAKIKKFLKRFLSPERRRRTSVDKNKKLTEAILKVTKNLEIEGIRDSNLINISFKHEDPSIAARIVNELARAYLEHYLKAYKTEKSDVFYQQQADYLKNKLYLNEEKQKDLKSQHNITSLDAQQQLLLSKAAELRSGLNDTLSKETETRNRIRELRSQLSRIPQTIPQEAQAGGNPYLINTLEARLVELQLKEKELMTKYTMENRFVRNVSDEIEVVMNKLAEQENKKYEMSRSGVNLTYQNLEGDLIRNEAELKAFKAKGRTQKAQLKEYQTELKNLGQIEAQYKRLAQEIEMDRKNYQNLLSKFEDSRISEAMDAEKIASVSLIEPAKPPLRPIWPKKKLNLLISIVFGFFGGLGLAFVMEYLNDSLERPEDIENILNAPVLTSIPKQKFKRRI